MLHAALNEATKENFETVRKRPDAAVIVGVLVVAYILCTALAIMYLWNTVLIRAMPGAKPVTLWQALALKLLISLLLY